MDQIIERDANNVTVLAGVTDDADQTISQLLVDSATDRLLIQIVPTVSSGTAGGSIAKRDQNFKTVLLAVNDVDEPIEVITDENGYLLVDIEYE